MTRGIQRIILNVGIKGEASTAVGRDQGFYRVAVRAGDHLVLAAVHAEGDHAADPGEEEEDAAPDPCHSSSLAVHQVRGLTAAICAEHRWDGDHLGNIVRRLSRL
jgi:hypothetical protein